jgi:hypothetical protein
MLSHQDYHGIHEQSESANLNRVHACNVPNSGLSAKDIIFPGQIDMVIGGGAAAGD